MRLFWKRRRLTETDQTPVPAALVPEVREISLSLEQKELLEQPVDPRVERILDTICDATAAAERTLNSRRIVDFPSPEKDQRLLDAI